MLEHDDVGRRGEGRTHSRRVGRDWRRAQGPAGQTRGSGGDNVRRARDFARAGVARRARAADPAGGSRHRADQGAVRLGSWRCLDTDFCCWRCRAFAADFAVLPGSVRSGRTGSVPAAFGGRFGGGARGGLDPRGAVVLVRSEHCQGGSDRNGAAGGGWRGNHHGEVRRARRRRLWCG